MSQRALNVAAEFVSVQDLLHTVSGFNARKKRPAVADVAIARELAGWAWSLAVLE
jgi:hypothetical protein